MRELFRFTSICMMAANILVSAHAAEEVEFTQLSEIGASVARPSYATDNVTAAFDNPGLGFAAGYAISSPQAVLTGIPVLSALYASKFFAAQVGAAVGTGYLSVAPGLALQIAAIGLRIGAYTNLQFNSFQWNNARFFATWTFGHHWSVGVRAGIAVVTNILDEVTLGVGKSWGILQTAVDLQLDGSLGTLRLIPGIGLHLGIFEAAISGSVARSSNWSFYADLLKVSAAIHLGSLAFIRAYYETPYAVGLGLGLTL